MNKRREYTLIITEDEMTYTAHMVGNPQTIKASDCHVTYEGQFQMLVIAMGTGLTVADAMVSLAASLGGRNSPS